MLRFGKPSTFVSSPAPSFNLANSEALTFGSTLNTLFGSTTSTSFGMRKTQSISNTYSFVSGAKFGLSTTTATFGFGSSHNLVLVATLPLFTTIVLPFAWTMLLKSSSTHSVGDFPLWIYLVKALENKDLSLHLNIYQHDSRVIEPPPISE